MLGNVFEQIKDQQLRTVLNPDIYTLRKEADILSEIKMDWPGHESFFKQYNYKKLLMNFQIANDHDVDTWITFIRICGQ